MQMTPQQRRDVAGKFAAQQHDQSMRIANGERMPIYEPIILDPEMHAWFQGWIKVGSSIGRWYLSNSREGKRIDAFILFAVPRALLLMLMKFSELAYVNATSFAWAHAGGLVSKDAQVERAKACGVCDQRFESGGHYYCHAFQKSCSSCPTKSWWMFSRLFWRASLRNQSCPKGLWDKRRFRAGIARKVNRSKAV